MGDIIPTNDQVKQLQDSIVFVQAHPEIASKVASDYTVASLVLTAQNLMPTVPDSGQKDYTGFILLASGFFLLGVIFVKSFTLMRR